MKRLVSILTVLALTVSFQFLVLPEAKAAACNYASALDVGEVTIEPVHGKIFYVDFRKDINAAYVGYKIKNDTASTKTNLWVRLSSFTASSGSVALGLANTADQDQQIASLTAGSTATVYFLIRASAETTASQSHNVNVYQGRPDVTGSSTLGNCDFAFTKVADTLAASANKVTSIGVSTNSPKVGSTLVVTVNGLTGKAGAGDSSGDGSIMWVSPASAANWPTRALRLESTEIKIRQNGNTVSDTYTNTLLIRSINSSPGYSSKTTYTATYTFRVLGGASINPIVRPVANIASGTQMKHTGTYPSTNSTIQLTSAATPMVVTKTASTTADATTSCSSSYIAVPYTISVRPEAGFAGTVSVDEIVDTPDTAVTYDSTATNARLTDVNNSSGKDISRSLVSGESPVKWHFIGPFVASADVPITITYTGCVPKTTGNYLNKAFGYIGSSIIGSSSNTVSTTTIGTNGTSTYTKTDSSVDKDKLTQTITFDALPSVGVGSETILYASSTSGLPVSFSTTTTSKCTVAQDATTGVWSATAVATTSDADKCTLKATQAGNVDYNSAETTRDLTILAGQFLQFEGLVESVTPDKNNNQTDEFIVESYKENTYTNKTGLSVTVESLTTSVCTVAAKSGATNTWIVTLIKGQEATCILKATQAGGSSGGITYGAALPVEGQVGVGKLQSITFDAISNQYSVTNSTESTASTTVSITATSYQFGTSTTSKLLVDFTSADETICTVATGSVNSTSGITTATVTKVAAGTCTIIAGQAGTTTGTIWLPADDVSQSFDIGIAQTITFNKPDNVAFASGTKAFSASTSSGLTLTYTLPSTTICAFGSLASKTLTTTGASGGNVTSYLVTGGTCSVTVSQAGNGRYWPATSVTQGFLITGAESQTISFTQADVNISTGDFNLSATATSGLPVTFSGSTASVCTVSELNVVLLTVGDCTVTANQSGNLTYAAASAVTVTFKVYAQPTISFSQATVDKGEYQITLSATHRYAAASGTVNTSYAVTFASSTTSVCTVSSSTLTLVAAGDCSITASSTANYPGSGYYLAASQAITFTVTDNAPLATTENIYGSVTTTTAVLQGNFDPRNGSSTTAVVLFGTSSTSLSEDSSKVAKYRSDPGSASTATSISSTTNGTNTFYSTAESLSPATKYYYRVKATRGSQNANGATKSFVTLPSAPTGVSISDVLSTSLKVNFTAVSQGTDVDVTYTVTCTGGKTATGSASPITVTDLSPSTAYTCDVEATSASTGAQGGGAGAKSSTASDTTRAAKISRTAAVSTTLEIFYGDTATVTVTGSGDGGTTKTPNSDGTKSVEKQSGPCAISSDELSSSGVGNCVIRGRISEGTEFAEAISSNVTVVIKKAIIAVTPTVPTVKYGDSAPTVTRTYNASNFKRGENESSADFTTGLTAPTCSLGNKVGTSTPYSSSANAGETFEISCTGGEATNYGFSHSPGTFQVQKADQTLSFNQPDDMRAGGSNQNLAASTSASGLSPSFEVDPTSTGICEIVGNAVKALASGTCKLIAKQNGNTNYNAASNSTRTFNITNAPSATTRDASGITKNEAKLNGGASEELSEPKFCYRTTSFTDKDDCKTTGTEKDAAEIRSGGTLSGYEFSLGSLPPSTIYYFILYGKVGTDFYSGTKKSFKTLPSVVTDAGTSVAARSATLNATTSESLTNPQFCLKATPFTTLSECLTGEKTVGAARTGGTGSLIFGVEPQQPQTSRGLILSSNESKFGSRKVESKKETAFRSFVVAGSINKEGSDTSKVSSSVTYTLPVEGLNPNTKYYFIIYGEVNDYVTNAPVTYDGGVKEFTTPAADSGTGGTSTAPVIPGPTITNISKAQICSIGSEIVITGRYFDGAVVTLDDASTIVVSLSSTTIQVQLPQALSGKRTIKVSTPHGVDVATIEYLTLPKPSFNMFAMPYLSQGSQSLLPFTATNALSFSIDGTLPSGLVLNTQTGLISGIPTANGIFTFYIVASGLCGSTSQFIELDIDKPTPNALSHRISILTGTTCLSDSAKASLELFLEKVKALSPRNLIPDIFISGGGIGSGSNLGDDRLDCVCELLLEEEVYGNVISGEFSGSPNRIEIIVYWARP